MSWRQCLYPHNSFTTSCFDWILFRDDLITALVCHHNPTMQLHLLMERVFSSAGCCKIFRTSFFFLPQNRILVNHYNISWWNDREGEFVCPSRQPTGAQRLLCNVLVHTLITWPHRLPVWYTDGHGCTVMKVFAVPQQQPPSLPSLLTFRPCIKREMMERSEIRACVKSNLVSCPLPSVYVCIPLQLSLSYIYIYARVFALDKFC